MRVISLRTTLWVPQSYVYGKGERTISRLAYCLYSDSEIVASKLISKPEVARILTPHLRSLSDNLLLQLQLPGEKVLNRA